ncbi:hypothetical protein Kpol_1028p81 [Vanderwaltozyma polyspora DSM 70294]|uniref:FAM86 N-terminal domain-containing protein n=1 Tax=Vanderwaltozyma polyspora (strain ATCC 22028 / DSM 70294 / BCRC 21397 / CBS 2163 / NBRC 10782 / NRRL Y-8283 / UCD 57-17) TaxID=436907 RepID=A7TG48_VANPO|nr:uncharacterized protein Kpol_1028p81 [Vanderwaltozyma polyspora DSM 70294]EDO18805.1 hypothetical protein Kpol_1028p81 [Vanderwaltozyma polyspora DSM 70294]
MECGEDLIYDLLRQRYPFYQLINFFKTHYNQETPLVLHAERFITELHEISSTNPYYIKNIIKVLTDNIDLLDDSSEGIIKVITEDDIDISEWLYEKYIGLLNLGQPDPTNTDVIQYRFNDSIKIKLEETPYVVSAAGTTGFRTWEAALFMTSFFVETGYLDTMSKKNILELGAGTGLVSIGLCKQYEDSIDKIYVTDGDSQLVEGQLLKNFNENELSHNDRVILQKLWWNVDDVPLDLDLIVAADVTYDSSVVPDLCETISNCFKRSSNDSAVCLLSATVRNEDTLDLFEKKCLELGLDCSIITTTNEDDQGNRLEQQLTFKPLIAPIRIYKITPK